MAFRQATFEFLSTAQFPSDYGTRLSAILPPLASWSPDLELWGSEDGNRVDVWIEGGQPIEGRVRFDLHELPEVLVLSLVQFAADAETGFRAENGLEIPASLPELIKALEGSRAARFVEDPNRYFKRLRAGGLEDL